MTQAVGIGRGSQADGVAEARRVEILDAAIELFAEHGYSDGVTQTLADRLQVGKGTIYRYFPSKRDLFLAAADRVMVRLRDHLDAHVATVPDPLERVEAGVREFLRFFDDHPGYVEMLIQERALFRDRTKSTFIQHREKNVVRWQELYRSLILDGRVRPMPVDQITGVVSDLLYGTIFTSYFAGKKVSPEAQAKEIVDVVFRGILADEERGKWGHRPPKP